MSEVIRVVLVDDDAMVRTALKMFLGGGSGIEVVGEADDGAAGVDLVRRERPDVVLMDIRMPVLDGLAATERVRALPDPPEVIVLTTFDADEYVLRALRIGAAGFLLKDTPPDRLVEAVRTVAGGSPILSPSVTAQLIAAVAVPSEPEDPARAQALARLESLTEREREVAEAVARGLSNAEIAAELFVGVPTVKTHVGRLFDKLAVENRVQIAILVHDATR
ncbi:MAG: response regulator transcription factor [Intrasporangiaceae bacterium]|nr:response regulator transcription factor [Intrasporangiaceae bacterium]